MRIGLVIEHFDPQSGGAERWIAAFAQYLVQMGHEVHIFTFKCQVEIAPLFLHVMPEPGTLIGRAQVLERFVVPFRPMVLHDSGTGWSGEVFHSQTGSRLLCVKQDVAARRVGQRVASLLSPRIWWRHHLMDRIERQAMQNAKRVIVASSRLKTLLSQRHHLESARLRTIPNGIDPARFTAEILSPLRAPFRHELGAGDALLCVMVAYNLRLKGLETALRAISIVLQQREDIRLAVAGGMPDAEMADLISRLGVNDKVQFCGNVAGIEKLFAAADVFVHPSRWDACSLATTEAMASGLPVITTVMDGASDLIKDGENGFVLRNPADHRRLAHCLTVLFDAAARRRIGDAARLKVSADRRQNDNFRAVEAVLAEACNET
jgi:UDP-glucose:(heptosyl)LPS alpha-1,3-glucosyltransferase